MDKARKSTTEWIRILRSWWPFVPPRTSLPQDMSTASTLSIEYVTETETLADITVKESTTASLRTSNAILLALLLLAAYILNLLVITTILVHSKLRTTIYLLFCHFSAIHMIDLSFTVMLSLIYVANESWVLGIGWCRVNAMIQEFCQLYTMMSLMLMCSERAVRIISMFNSTDYQLETPSIIEGKRLLISSLTLWVVSLAISIPTVTSVIPVKPFKNRYICAVDAYCPLAYPTARVVIFVGCLICSLVCVGTILKKRNGASLPQQTREYSEFIKKNRAHQELQSRAKLVVFLLVVFLLVEGPYITLNFIYEISNSAETLAKGPSQEIPQDADILLTWLKFVYPLLSPIIILSWCSDIWLKVKELFCCQSYEPPTIGQFIGANQGIPGVMTLVATPEGLQLRMPAQSTPIYQPPPPVATPSFSVSPPAPDPASLAPPSAQPRVVERRAAPLVQNAQTNTSSSNLIAQQQESRTPAAPSSQPRGGGVVRSTRNPNPATVSRIPKPTQSRVGQNNRRGQNRRVKPATTTRR